MPGSCVSYRLRGVLLHEPRRDLHSEANRHVVLHPQIQVGIPALHHDNIRGRCAATYVDLEAFSSGRRRTRTLPPSFASSFTLARRHFRAPPTKANDHASEHLLVVHDACMLNVSRNQHLGIVARGTASRPQRFRATPWSAGSVCHSNEGRSNTIARAASAMQLVQRTKCIEISLLRGTRLHLLIRHSHRRRFAAALTRTCTPLIILHIL